MDILKRFSATGVKQVLFGTEEMQPLLRINGQLSRRTPRFYFDAYDSKDVDDVNAFHTAFGFFVSKLPPDYVPSSSSELLRPV